MQSDSSQMDSVAPQEYSIPTMADFMIAYSTIPGECESAFSWGVVT